MAYICKQQSNLINQNIFTISEWYKTQYNELMRQLSLLFIPVLSLSLFWFSHPLIQAGGGPIEVRLSAVQGYVNQKVKFDVYFHPTKPDEIPAQTMYLYLQDPKDGRSCKLYSDRTDNTGKVSGECTSSLGGDLKFYIHWMEGGRSSEDQTITFYKAPALAASPTVVVKTQVVAPSPVSCPTANCPSPVCNPSPTIATSPLPTKSPSPQPISSPEVKVVKEEINTKNTKWLIVVALSFGLGLGLPIIFYLIIKK